jgi:hypothetical protein
MCRRKTDSNLLKKRAKTGWLGLRIMCPSGATCLPADCCFSEVALERSNEACWSSTKWTSSSFHWMLSGIPWNNSSIYFSRISRTKTNVHKCIFFSSVRWFHIVVLFMMCFWVNLWTDGHFFGEIERCDSRGNLRIFNMIKWQGRESHHADIHSVLLILLTCSPWVWLLSFCADRVKCHKTHKKKHPKTHHK